MNRQQPSSAKAAASSLNARILSDIRGRILRGDWSPGTRIPFERDLAASYGCSRMTVNKVLTQLARAGFVERRRKAGTFVARPRAQSAVLDIHDIGREVRDLGLPYSFVLTRRRERHTLAADSGLLDVPPGTPLLELVCRHAAAGQPFCLEERLINLEAVGEAARADFTAVAPGTWLTTEVPWTEAEHRILAAAADAKTAAALALPPGAACLVVERRTWSAGRPITYVMLTYPAGAHQVVARFTPTAP